MYIKVILLGVYINLRIVDVKKSVLLKMSECLTSRNKNIWELILIHLNKVYFMGTSNCWRVYRMVRVWREIAFFSWKIIMPTQLYLILSNV